MSVGYVPCDAAAWSQQRLRILGPWPDVLAQLDLRFWADPMACGHQARPSYRGLAAAWGWSLGRVQRLVTAPPRWTDPWRDRINGGTPAEQERDGEDTNGDGQTPATDEKRNTSGTRAEQERDAGGTGHKGTPAGSTGTGTDNALELTGAAADATTRGDLERQFADQLWEHWRQQRRPVPGEGKRGRLWHTSQHFDPDDRGKLIARLQARATSHRKAGLRRPADLQAAACDARDLIDCFHQAPSCAHWQGENPADRVYLAIGTLFKPDKMGTRWELLADWDAAGRPRVSAPGQDDGGNGVDYKAEAERAWPWLLEQIAVHGSYLPRPLAAHDPAKDAALWSAIEAIGDVGALSGRADAVQRLRWSFVTAYVKARQETTP